MKVVAIKGGLTQKTIQQHPFVLHRQNRPFSILFDPFFKIGGEFIEWANESTGTTLELLRRRWVINLHY